MDSSRPDPGHSPRQFRVAGAGVALLALLGEPSPPEGRRGFTRDEKKGFALKIRAQPFLLVYRSSAVKTPTLSPRVALDGRGVPGTISLTAPAGAAPPYPGQPLPLPRAGQRDLSHGHPSPRGGSDAKVDAVFPFQGFWLTLNVYPRTAQCFKLL